jgi:hypothetical protein
MANAAGQLERSLELCQRGLRLPLLQDGAQSIDGRGEQRVVSEIARGGDPTGGGLFRGMACSSTGVRCCRAIISADGCANAISTCRTL